MEKPRSRTNLKLLEGLTPQEIDQIKSLEERLQKERQECEKIEKTIQSITEDMVEGTTPQVRKSVSPVRNPKTDARSPLRSATLRRSTFASSSKRRGSGRRKMAAVMSPRYAPPPPDPAISSGHHRRRPRSETKKKGGTVYTNFSRAVRFEWQKYEKPTSGIPVDITHRSHYVRPKPSPSPCSYNIPTSFSPYVDKGEKSDEPPAVPSSKTETTTAASEPSPRRKLGYGGETTSAAEDVKTATNDDDEQAIADGVDEFVRSSVRGESLKIWETSPKKWTDADGYEHTGRYVNIKSNKSPTRRPRMTRGEKYMRSHQGKSFDQLAIEKLFDQIDTNHDGAISGPELKLFLLEQNGLPAANALRKYLSRARYFHHGGNLFNVFDKNHDHVISRTEFATTLLATEEKRELSELFDKIDANHDGAISGAELNAYLERVEDTPEGLRLKKFIFEGRRMFLASENLFEEDFDEVGERTGHKERSKIFKSLDTNDDGEISRHEFIRALERGLRRVKSDERRGPSDRDFENATSAEKLRAIFHYYCNFGDRFKDELSTSGWTKMIRDCDLKHPKPKHLMLLDAANLTLGDLGIIFNTAVQYEMTHRKHGMQSWESVMREANRSDRHVKMKWRISYTTMLYALRILCNKRWPNPKQSSEIAASNMKKLLVEHLLPLYDDDVAFVHSTYAKMEANFKRDLHKYKVHFYDVEERSEDGKTHQIGSKAFFAKHRDGLKSIFDRYASLDAATSSNDDGELQYIAKSSWMDVKEVNSTLDWLEFSTFLQDFGVFEKLASRILMQRLFLHFASNDFEWHDKSGKKAVEGETSLKAMRFEGFCNALGILSMMSFDKEAMKGQCPTPKSKLELLFFKMKRPKWLLAASEKRMTNSIDAAVRGQIMSDMKATALKKFLAPKAEIESVKGILEELSCSASPSVAVFEK